MSRIRADQPLVPSVLDRLIDHEPEVTREPAKARHQLLRDLRTSVRRDLENLLNHRRSSFSRPDLAELRPSLVDYGLPDFHGMVFANDEGRERLRSQIEELVRTYEPRFKSVHVELLENAQQFDRTLRFRVHGMLHAEPAPEPVTFDSSLEPTVGVFRVKGTEA